MFRHSSWILWISQLASFLFFLEQLAGQISGLNRHAVLWITVHNIYLSTHALLILTLLRDADKCLKLVYNQLQNRTPSILLLNKLLPVSEDTFLTDSFCCCCCCLINKVGDVDLVSYKGCMLIFKYKKI